MIKLVALGAVAITFVLGAGLPDPLAAQVSANADTVKTREVQLEADFGVRDEIDGESVYRLDGNVRLRQEDTVVRSNRAVQYERSELVVFEGNVVIVDLGDTLRADRIEYHSDTKIADGGGSVVWTDGQVHVTAREGRYRVDDKIATFEGDVLMRDSTTTITSRLGEYLVDDEVAKFQVNVALEQEDLSLMADSITHYRETGRTEAAGSVRIYQMEERRDQSRVVLLADRAEAERQTGESVLWGDPVLVRLHTSDSSVDTLIVRANRLEAADSDTAHSFRAMGAARMWRGDLTGIADTLRYLGAAEADTAEIRMSGAPVLWSRDAQISGDSIRVRLTDGNPTELISGPNAFVAFEDTALGRFQQIKGARLVALFSSDSLRQLVVRPQAEALYFGDESSDKEESAVQFSSSAIQIHFAVGEIDKIVASTDVEGEIKKFEPATPPTLPGFDWQVQRRPEPAEMMPSRVVEALKAWPEARGQSTRPLKMVGTADD